MLRLLQGDVGSGKTLVAVLAMLAAVEAGAQAAFLAPTEILARQHHATLLGAARQPSACASRSSPAARRAGRGNRCCMGLADGSIDILVGTHAIFQEKVAYKRLGLSVIDEQHRFGVSQRLLLADKGRAPAAPAGDDRDADPAHADADPIWRDGRQPDRRDAAGPDAGRNAGDQRREAARRDRRPRPPPRRAAARPIGYARWSRRARRSTPPRPRSARACSSCASARTRSGWSTGA